MGSEDQHPILCGRCKIPVDVSAGRERRVCCPACGQTDTLEEARREAGQHTAHTLLWRMLQGVLKKDQQEPSFRFVEGESRAERAFAWRA